jgi:beta-aspartyl-peptidase (threonine type)
LQGRTGDSCIIGASCYANSNCAVSGTDEGEFLIRGVVAHSIAMMVECSMTLHEACNHVIFQRQNELINGGMGVISVDKECYIAHALNTEIMKRAWIGSNEPLFVGVFP